MGVIDRDWYHDRGPQEPRAAATAKPSGEADRGPIYVSDTGTASRFIDADPRLRAVYAQRAKHALEWRRIWRRTAAVAVLVLLAWVLWRLRR